MTSDHGTERAPTGGPPVDCYDGWGVMGMRAFQPWPDRGLAPTASALVDGRLSCRSRGRRVSLLALMLYRRSGPHAAREQRREDSLAQSGSWRSDSRPRCRPGYAGSRGHRRPGADHTCARTRRGALARHLVDQGAHVVAANEADGQPLPLHARVLAKEAFKAARLAVGAFKAELAVGKEVSLHTELAAAVTVAKVPNVVRSHRQALHDPEYAKPLWVCQ